MGVNNFSKEFLFVFMMQLAVEIATLKWSSGRAWGVSKIVGQVPFSGFSHEIDKLYISLGIYPRVLWATTIECANSILTPLAAVYGWQISAPFQIIQHCSLFMHTIFLYTCYSPNSVVTLGVLTVVVKGRVARSRWRTGGARISSLFSWFRACMFVSPVNFRSFGLAAAGVSGFRL